MQTLRDYQAKALEDLRDQIRNGFKRLILVAPTGAGKTTIAAAMIHGGIQRNKRILFLAHRRELIDQCCDRLAGLDVPHGVIMAGDPRFNLDQPVQVASVQTLIRRDTQFNPDLIFIDECHHARAESYTTIIERHPDAILIGLTATPIRTDGRGLGNLFDAMVQCPPLSELTEMGYLVPSTTYTQPKTYLNLKGVRKTGGDYSTGDLAERVNKPKLIGNLISHWKKYANGRRTITFAVNVEHSQAIAAEFNAANIPTEHLDGETDTDTRKAILARLASGTTLNVVNCMVLTEGFDCPPVSCVILARPTASLGLYLQMAGRALRTHPNKPDCIILDHAGCVHAHGLCSAPREWLLTTSSALPEDRPNIADTYKVCPDCGAVTPRPTPTCVCGYQFTQKEIQITHDEDTNLVKVDHHLAHILTSDHKRSFYRKKLWAERYELTRSGSPFKRGYADAVYRSTMGTPPPPEWRRTFTSACKYCEAAGLKPHTHFNQSNVEQIADNYAWLKNIQQSIPQPPKPTKATPIPTNRSLFA